jgi:hypothetical protein
MAHIGGDQADCGHQLWPIRCKHARHPIAERVPDDKGRSVRLVRNDVRDVRRAIVQIDVLRPAAASDSARLRPQHPKTGACEPPRDLVEVGGAAAERWQKHRRKAFPLCHHLDLRVATRQQSARHRHRGRHRIVSSRAELFRPAPVGFRTRSSGCSQIPSQQCAISAAAAIRAGNQAASTRLTAIHTAPRGRIQAGQ